MCDNFLHVLILPITHGKLAKEPEDVKVTLSSCWEDTYDKVHQGGGDTIRHGHHVFQNFSVLSFKSIQVSCIYVHCIKSIHEGGLVIGYKNLSVTDGADTTEAVLCGGLQLVGDVLTLGDTVINCMLRLLTW